MFIDMKIQWAGTLLGCVAAVLIPVPIAFYLYGPKLRQKSKWAPTLPPQADNEIKKTLDQDSSVVE